MKKRVMLAMAIIMVLGSVKAMASSMEMEMAEGKWAAAAENLAVSSDEMVSDDIMSGMAIDKTIAAEADMVRTDMLTTIREKIIVLKENSQSFDEVRVGKEVVSRDQALFAAEADLAALTKKFDKKSAEQVIKILEASIASLK
ncbi:hypothetical protein [Bdellovibrio sp. HCB274]|uniref:hypothetical protein n=1 Tax=Bdellovibrio sp. HCB274 TaxID=3394361 RepID=UPI0039B3C249